CVRPPLAGALSGPAPACPAADPDRLPGQRGRVRTGSARASVLLRPAGLCPLRQGLFLLPPARALLGQSRTGWAGRSRVPPRSGAAALPLRYSAQTVC